MGIMQGYVPGPGLFPMLLGYGIAALSLINLIRAFTGLEKLPSGMTKKEIFQVLAIIVILFGNVISTPFLGLTVATFITMILMGMVLQQKKGLRSGVILLLVSLVTTVGCRLLFQNVLKVPVPIGILGF